MGVSVGYGDWNQIDTLDADLDISDSGGSYGPGTHTYGRFNCQNWATFALNINTIVGALEIDLNYYPSETAAALFTRAVYLDTGINGGMVAFYPNLAPWMDVTVGLLGGGNFQLNAFGWRTNRVVPSVYVNQATFLVNTGAVTIAAGVTRTQAQLFAYAGTVGYRWATNADAGTLTVEGFFNGSYVTLHTENLAAAASNDGLLLLPEMITHWQIKNTGATSSTFALNVWPVPLAQR